jgi:hypothetical protein
MARLNGVASQLAELEQKFTRRIESLERQIVDLRAELAKPREPDWRRTIGMFETHPGLEAVFAEAMKLRAADRETARRDADRPKTERGPARKRAV